jgi:hypothetical protein
MMEFGLGGWRLETGGEGLGPGRSRHLVKKKARLPRQPGFGKGGRARLQGSLERCGGFEAYRLGRVDLHGLPGFRVATHAGSAVFHFERSKTNQLDLGVSTDTVGDGVEDCGYGVFGSTLGGVFAQRILDGFDQFGFIHGLSLLREV